MGNQNCCVRSDNPSKTLANFDIINEDKFETAPQNMQITENVLNLGTAILEEKENKFAVKASKKGKINNELIEEPVHPNTVTKETEIEPTTLY